LIGVVVAAGALTLTKVFRRARFDAAGSLVIGGCS